MAQAAEFIGIAQVFSLDDLVGGGREGAIHRLLVRPAARQLPGTPRTPGVIVAGAGHHLALGVGIAVLLGIGIGAVGRRAVHRGLRAGAGALAAFALVFT